MRRLKILTLCSLVLAIGVFFLKKRNPATIASGKGLVIKKEWLVANKTPLTPVANVRPPDQTFLTFPEWYLVFSPEEQANYFKTHTATSFPFMSHVSQMWYSYKIVYDQIKDNFPYNGGYHFMIWVIASSTTAEYAIKAWYETLIGRITDTHAAITDEDKFNAKFTNDYVVFIKDRPWYEFDFKTRLKALWKNTSFLGDHFLRKMERKYILTSELFCKYVYGKLIGLGTKTVYDEALPTTAVVVDSLPANSTFKVLKKFPDNSVMVYLPRYDKFNPTACQLAQQGVNFKEIAGNTSAILLTAMVPANVNISEENAQVVFTQPIASNPQEKRVAIATPVSNLSKLLNSLAAKHITIEHVFDY